MGRMTTLAIFTRFQRLYQEKSSRFFDSAADGWAIHAMNHAIDFLDSELADIHPEVVGLLSTDANYTVGQQEENLPQGVQEIVMIEVTDRGGPPFPRLTPAQFTSRSGFLSVPWSISLYPGIGRGEPREYYVRTADPADAPLKIGWIPIPDRSSTGAARVWHHGTRAEVAAIDGSFPDITAILHPCIAAYMAVLAAIADGAKVEYYQGLFNSTFENRKSQLIRGFDEAEHEQIQITDMEDFV